MDRRFRYFGVSEPGRWEGKFGAENQKDKVSYVIGMDMGSNFKKQSIDIDPDILVRGIKDGLSGGKSLIDRARNS